MANAVAQALNADASLKAAKITVQPDDGNILLTGSVMTEPRRTGASTRGHPVRSRPEGVNTMVTGKIVLALAGAALLLGGCATGPYYDR